MRKNRNSCDCTEIQTHVPTSRGFQVTNSTTGATGSIRRAEVSIELLSKHSIYTRITDPHIQRIVLAPEETTVTQRVSHRPTKCQSCLWSQRGTNVNGSHHSDNPVLEPTGIQIATNSLPGPATREHRKLISAKTISLGTNYSFYCLE